MWRWLEELDAEQADPAQVLTATSSHPDAPENRELSRDSGHEPLGNFSSDSSSAFGTQNPEMSGGLTETQRF